MSFLCEPYLLTLKPDREMSVVWITKEKTTCKLEFGKDRSLGKEIMAECYEIVGLRAPKCDGTYGETPEEHEKISVWQHIATIKNLSAGERIFYRAVNGDESTKIYDFHTAPKEGENFKFLQLSDLQGLDDCYDTVYKGGLSHPDFLLYSGDATYISWRLDQWFDTHESWQSDTTRKTAFFPCMQQENGAKLMQYAPLFFCPGNHELDDLRVYLKKEYGSIEDNWNWSIFMQIFRPLYPGNDYTLTGKRWYSVDYGDMHIISLIINHFCCWPPEELPGWRAYDPIEPDSPQVVWLKNDFAKNNSKFKWVIQHFHFLNKGHDVQFNFCTPVIDEKGIATYPYDRASELMDIYSENGVNAVTYGHSHVYERYFRKSTHFIEAAYMSVCFRLGGEPTHPSGLLPIVENNSQRSFLVVERREDGLFATGYFASDKPEPFDSYQIADKNGKTVKPQ